MPGALTHIGVALFSAALVYYNHFKGEFAFAVFIGNLLPDVLKFGITAAKQGMLNFVGVNKSDPVYMFLSATTNDTANWFSAGFFVLALLLFMYHYHYIKRKKMEEYSELYGFLLAGVLTHLILDVLIIERSAWI